MAEEYGRISASKDFLRAELKDLELRLVGKLATQDDVDELRRDVDSLKRWRAYLAGAATACTLLAGTCLAFVLHPWH